MLSRASDARWSVYDKDTPEQTKAGHEQGIYHRLLGSNLYSGRTHLWFSRPDVRRIHWMMSSCLRATLQMRTCSAVGANTVSSAVGTVHQGIYAARA